jgi:LCP family protein required for cell wall assembly
MRLAARVRPALGQDPARLASGVDAARPCLHDTGPSLPELARHLQARPSATSRQARHRAPTTGATDRRRLTAAALSAVVPGLGQAYNGRGPLAARLAVPALVLIALAAVALLALRPAELLATLIVPRTLGVVLILNAVVLAWRLFAVGHAFMDARFEGSIGRSAVIGLALIVTFVAVPQVIGGYYGYLAFGAFGRIFDRTDRDDPNRAQQAPPLGPTPAGGARVNVLLMGVDSGFGRAHALTDTLIVVSLDPVGKTVSMVSVPRDMVSVPLGNGNKFGPKINSLLSYAGEHRAEFPGKNPTRVLEDAIGTLLGIPIHYYAKVNLAGFVKVVDAVGGVEVNVKTPLLDPDYGGYGFQPGTEIKAGRQHMDGATAEAYARIRKSGTETDFTRAARQQEVLVAIRDAAIKRNLLFSLPSLLDALADTVQTDLPPEQLPGLAALAEEIGGPRTVRVVIHSPLVHSGEPNNPYGSVQVPVLDKILAMARLVFPPPGTPPTPWPTPSPSRTPRPSRTPGASATS